MNRRIVAGGDDATVHGPDHPPVATPRVARALWAILRELTPRRRTPADETGHGSEPAEPTDEGT